MVTEFDLDAAKNLLASELPKTSIGAAGAKVLRYAEWAEKYAESAIQEIIRLRKENSELEYELNSVRGDMHMLRFECDSKGEEDGYSF